MQTPAVRPMYIGQGGNGAAPHNTRANTPMATKAQAPAPTVAKGKAAPAPTSANPGQQVANNGQLFTLGKLPPVRGGTIRHYMQAVAQHVASANPAGFTLAQYRAALVANPLPAQHPAAGVAVPTCGWQAHNAPTWCSNPKQAWLVPVASK